jgi:hypothetical protein
VNHHRTHHERTREGAATYLVDTHHDLTTFYQLTFKDEPIG